MDTLARHGLPSALRSFVTNVSRKFIRALEIFGSGVLLIGMLLFILLMMVLDFLFAMDEP